MASATLSRPVVRAVKALPNLRGGLVTSVSWKLEGPNTATIEFPRKRVQEFRQYSAGKPVYIEVWKNFRKYLIFQGYITGRSLDFSSDSEGVTIVCQGPKWRLGADFVKGRYMLVNDGKYKNLTGLKTIFNESIENSQISPQNASATKASKGIMPFSLNPLDSSQSTIFDVNAMLWYCYYLRTLTRDVDVIGDPLTLTEFGIGELGELEIYDVDVDGLSVYEAMNSILKRAGLKWWCRPVSVAQSEIRAFLAGPLADAPEKYVYLADIDTGVLPGTKVNPKSISLSKNNVEAGRLNEDFAEVANEVFAYGARKIYQKEFTLKPGWSSDLWDELKAYPIETIRRETREETSVNWEKYKDVGRLWILDETGSVNGESYDFDSLFDSEIWAKMMRPFLGSLVDNTDFNLAKAKNPLTDVFEPVSINVKILKDRAGIYLEGGELEAPIFTELSVNGLGAGAGTLADPDPKLATELKFTACALEDKALEIISTEDGAQGRKQWLVGIIPNDDGTNSEITRRIALVYGDEYQTDNQNPDKEEETKEKLEDLATRKRQENQDPQVSASLSIPWITTAYEPGDKIIGIRGRDLYFTAQIIEVRFSFGESQRTELILEDMRLAEN